MATGSSSDGGGEQRKIQLREELAQHEKQMRGWADKSIKRIEKEQWKYDVHLEERDEVVGRALRLGLTDHPFVKHWLSEKRSFGEWDELRRFRANLETGVKRPMSKEDFWVSYHAYALSKKGKKSEGIRRELCRKLRFDKPEGFFGLTEEETKQLAERLSAMPRQNFHRLLRKLNVID